MAAAAEKTLVVQEEASSTTITTTTSTTDADTVTTTTTTTTSSSVFGRLWGFGRAAGGGGGGGGGATDVSAVSNGTGAGEEVAVATLETSSSSSVSSVTHTRRESKRALSLVGPTASGVALPSEGNKEVFEALKAKIAAEQPEDNVSPFNEQYLLNNVLVARNLDVEAAFKQWQGIVTWRKAYQPDQVEPADEEAYMSQGVITHCGPDMHGRPVIYAHSKNHLIDAEHHERNLRVIVNLLDKAKQEGVRGADGFITVIIDQEGMGRKNMDTHLFIGNPGLVHILQDYFPETLGVCILMHTGLLFRIMWAIISPFLDEKTRNKVKVLSKTEDVLDYIEPANLPPQLQAKVGYTPDAGK